ncbi:receptor L domain protein [Teladorsagia circumcincta]|uniref:Receptor L domain protein n=1 Tax=Teladorsagia circumcincta TaxID=45464 RepID=A0A2G9V372_TELCI|nr:receptor L domain protein [Teladorsagia circumcincta]
MDELTSYHNADSGCELDEPLTQAIVSALEDNCELIYGDFILASNDTPSYDLLMRKFGAATEIVGQVIVMNTELVDLGFLGSVRRISYYYFDDEIVTEKFVQVALNDKLERLKWSKLEDISIVTVQISGNPKLCFTANEMSGLFSALEVAKMEGRVCEGKDRVSLRVFYY